MPGATMIVRATTKDFADCLHLALETEAGDQPLRTFDQRAAKVINARLLRIRKPRLAKGQVRARRYSGLIRV